LQCFVLSLRKPYLILKPANLDDVRRTLGYKAFHARNKHQYALKGVSAFILFS